MRHLYLDCSSGISGDMAVAAMIDLGADPQELTDVLDSLDTEEFVVSVSKVLKSGIEACDFDVNLLIDNHDHDMEYLHGGSVAHVPHGHTGLRDVERIIDASSASDDAKALAMRIFDIVAEAEGRVHGKTKEEVHFHEVGALDSIIDILSFAVCFLSLGIDSVIVTGLTDGRGTVRCAHGVIPVPVPAVLEIICEHELPLTISDVFGELVTPTGAAIAAAIRTERELPTSFRVISVGIGAGKRDYEAPGVLRAMIIEDGAGEDTVCCLQANIDDCTGEMMADAASRIMEAGAKDVAFSPIYVKKGRPGYRIEVMCSPEDAGMFSDMLFAETTTIGVRRSYVHRTILDRRIETFDTSFGPIKAKVCRTPEGERAYPEYESVASAAQGLPFADAYRLASEEINRQL